MLVEEFTIQLQSAEKKGSKQKITSKSTFIVYFGVILRLQLHGRDDFVLFLLIFYSFALIKDLFLLSYTYLKVGDFLQVVLKFCEILFNIH